MFSIYGVVKSETTRHNKSNTAEAIHIYMWTASVWLAGWLAVVFAAATQISFGLNENIFILFNHIRQKKWHFPTTRKNLCSVVGRILERCSFRNHSCEIFPSGLRHLEHRANCLAAGCCFLRNFKAGRFVVETRDADRWSTLAVLRSCLQCFDARS